MKKVTICGVSESELKNGWCYKCGNGVHCEIRKEDWVSEQIYNFCKSHNCLKSFFGSNYVYDEWLFLQYLAEHPNEIRKRKWLQDIAIKNKISF